MKIFSKVAGWFGKEDKPPPVPEKEPVGHIRDWTLLVYGAANAPDIDWYVSKSVESLGEVGSNLKLGIAAQLAQNSRGGQGRRLSFQNGTRTEAELGPINTGDPNHLESFLRWGIEKYPARHYAVVLSGHGGAHAGVCEDEIHRDHLTLNELSQALQGASQQAGQRLDVLVHMSCFMACAEAVTAVQDQVEFVVASEGTSTDGNPNLYRLASQLKGHLQQGPQDARQVVKMAFDCMEKISAHSFSHAPSMPQLSEKIRSLSSRLESTPTPTETLAAVMDRALHFGGAAAGFSASPPFRHTKDLSSLAHALAAAPEISDSELKAAAAEVARSVRPAVVHGGLAGDVKLRSAQGMSIWAPTTPVTAQQLENYKATHFAQTTGWDRVLKRISQAQAS